MTLSLTRWDKEIMYSTCQLKIIIDLILKSFIIIEDDRPDYKEARRWKDERKQVKAGSTFYFHNPTFTGNSVVGKSGIINDVKFGSQKGDQEVYTCIFQPEVEDQLN
jgi:hypothetical protein